MQFLKYFIAIFIVLTSLVFTARYAKKYIQTKIPPSISPAQEKGLKCELLAKTNKSDYAQSVHVNKGFSGGADFSNVTLKLTFNKEVSHYRFGPRGNLRLQWIEAKQKISLDKLLLSVQTFSKDNPYVHEVLLGSLPEGERSGHIEVETPEGIVLCSTNVIEFKVSAAKEFRTIPSCEMWISVNAAPPEEIDEIKLKKVDLKIPVKFEIALPGPVSQQRKSKLRVLWVEQSRNVTTDITKAVSDLVVRPDDKVAFATKDLELLKNQIAVIEIRDEQDEPVCETSELRVRP